MTCSEESAQGWARWGESTSTGRCAHPGSGDVSYPVLFPIVTLVIILAISCWWILCAWWFSCGLLFNPANTRMKCFSLPEAQQGSVVAGIRHPCLDFLGSRAWDEDFAASGLFGRWSRDVGVRGQEEMSTEGCVAGHHCSPTKIPVTCSECLRSCPPSSWEVGHRCPDCCLHSRELLG